MNRADQNINKDMFDSDLIDVESFDFNDDQTWLCSIPEDSGQKLDIVTWNLTCDWPFNEDDDYLQMEKQLNSLLDNIIRNEALSMPDKHKFDSRTYVRPKKRASRPSIQNIVEVPSNPTSMSPHPSLNPAFNPALNHVMNVQGSGNKFLTYNKYNSPLGAISPLLRLKTFNVDTHTENSTAVKEYALKRRSLVQDEDPQLEDVDLTLVSETSARLSMEHTHSKPINIDLSQPAHNLHNTFNKGVTNMFDRPSLNMYQSGESLMRMSPPSLVSSLLMDSSGTFNPESMDSRKSAPAHDTVIPAAGRDSVDPMVTSMTLSILDEKDMSTSFLSQTTYPDHDSLLDSLPPSLVNSVNSSYVVSNTSKPRDNDSNIFSSATFTHLEQSEKLLSARPRCHLYNSFTKRESSIRNSESYTKSREEACQIDAVKVLNENSKESPKPKTNDMTETITLHYSNNKFIDAEKENFEKDDAFYKDMGIPKPEEPRNSLNVTLGKQELNEIIQARQKLSLARRGLPSEPEKPLPNQIDSSPIKTIHLPNQIITVPKQSMENASELLSRRRAMNNGFERSDEAARVMPTRELRDAPKRHATFKVSPRASEMDTTVVYIKPDETPPSDNNIIDINSATIDLLNEGETTLQHEEWCSQERAMVGSSESTDTGTFSSSSPPDSVPDTHPHPHPHPHPHRAQIASTPLVQHRRGVKSDLLNTTTISPIYDMVPDKSYTHTKAPSNAHMERTYDANNTTVVNSATIVKKTSAKRDILAGKSGLDKKIPSQIKPTNRTSPTAAASHGSIVPPSGLPMKSGLPTSKLRQYSSHRELSRIPGGPPLPAGAALSRAACGAPAGRAMLRRAVYASNPALSPTAPAPALTYADLHREEPAAARPVLTNPPALVRQGTETLRRDRPASQIVAPRDLRGAGSGVPVSMRNHYMPPPSTRPYSIACAPPRVSVARPASVPAPKPGPAPVTEQPRPASSSDARLSALPRPSRLPAPRRAIRPPSTYTVAPSADADQY